MPKRSQALSANMAGRLRVILVNDHASTGGGVLSSDRNIAGEFGTVAVAARWAHSEDYKLPVQIEGVEGGIEGGGELVENVIVEGCLWLTRATKIDGNSRYEPSNTEDEVTGSV